MSFKDKLKQSQGSGSSFPKLPIIANIEIKDSPTGVPEFQCYDKEQKINVKVNAPLQGIFIGSAMQLSAYSDSLGTNGGNYKSDFYIKTDNVTLFEPQRDGYKAVVKGKMEEVDAYLASVRPPVTPKKRQVIFLLTEGGLVSVITNLSIAIDQLGAVRDRLSENIISLTPKLFSENDPKISKKAKEYLGKFRQKNPPKYAEVEVLGEITEDIWERYQADQVVDAFVAWKEYKEAGQPKLQEENKPSQTADTNTAYTSRPPQPTNEFAQNNGDLPWENDPLA